MKIGNQSQIKIVQKQNTTMNLHEYLQIFGISEYKKEIENLCSNTNEFCSELSHKMAKYIKYQN